MGRRSRSKRSKERKQKRKRRQGATRTAQARPSIEELIQIGDFNGAIALLEERLAESERAEDLRLLVDVLCRKAERTNYPERKALYSRAADYLQRLPVSLEAKELRLRTVVACNAERWAEATSWAEQLLAVEQTAFAYYYRAVAAAGTFVFWDLLDDREREEVVKYLEWALEQDDAWPQLVVIRAEVEGIDDSRAENRIRILREGLLRFPNDPDITVRLAQELRDDEQGLELVLPHALTRPPHGDSLYYALQYASRIYPDLALELVDHLEAHATESWAGFEILRGRIQFNRGLYHDALLHYQSALKLAESLGDRAIAFEAWMGIAAVHSELKEIDAALEATVNASNQLLAKFGVEFPYDGGTTIADTTFTVDVVESIDHVVTIRVLEQWAEDHHPQSDHALTRLRLVGYVLAREWGSGEQQFPELPEWDDRFSMLKAEWLRWHKVYDEAFRIALGHAIWIAQVGSSPGESGYVFTNFWPDSVWDDAQRCFVDAPEELKRAFHDIAIECMRQLLEDDLDEQTQHHVLLNVFLPLYRRRWRAFLLGYENVDEAEEVVEALEPVLPREDLLFDQGYFALKRGGERATQVAEACYRTYIEQFGPTDAVANNLAVALERQGRYREAVELFNLAADLSEQPDEFRERARRAEQKAIEAEKRELERRRAEERQRKKLEDFLASAPERWPDLNRFQRSLLCTLSVISGFESFEELARLAGQDVRYVRGHYRKLHELGMIIAEDGQYKINPHIRYLIERERSHAVYSRIIHHDNEIAFKPIFNSRNEYRIYQVLVEIFPNNLVFPNMALQSIFSYDRMRELLDPDEFAYFLRASVDFCIVSTASYLPLVAFEADSYWHETERQKERDAIKDKIFRLGGRPLIRLRPYGQPSENGLRTDVIRAVQEWLSTRTKAELLIGHGLDPLAELDLSQIGKPEPQGMEVDATQFPKRLPPSQ